MKPYILAEGLKYRRTPMKIMTVMMPLVTVLLAAWLTHNFFAVDSYNWWYMALYPGFLGILCSMIGEKEKRKKNYTIWSLPCDMGKIWDAKILVGVAVSGISVVCVVLFTMLIGKGMEIVFHITYIVAPSFGRQILAGIVMWVTTLWQIPFCLFLIQKMGTFLMLVVHMGCYAVFSVTVSLRPWFALVPGAITSRLLCPLLGVLPNGLFLQPGQMTYSPELAGMENLLIGIPAALFWFFLFWLVSRRWFERQVASE